MKRLSPKLTISQTDLAANFFDVAADYPKETFEQITKRILPRGFGRSKTSALFKREARRMFNLAR